MRSAFSTSVLFALLCVAGLASLLFSTFTLFGSLRVGSSPVSIFEACCGLVLARLSVGWLLLVAVAVAVGFVVARTVRGLLRLRSASRRIDGLRRVSEAAEVSGISCRIYEDSRPMAFCAGLLKPEVFVSRAAADQLPAEVLRVVMAHEDHHRLRRDPLRRALARTLADGFFFLPLLGQIGRKRLALSEIRADRAAATSVDGGRREVAGALLAVPAVGGNPREASSSIDRIDDLAGGGRGWRPSLPVLFVTLAALAALFSAPMVSAELLLVGTVIP